MFCSLIGETSEVNFTGTKSRIRYLIPLSTLINNVVTVCKLKLNNLSCFVRNSYFSVDLEAMHLGFEAIRCKAVVKNITTIQSSVLPIVTCLCTYLNCRPNSFRNVQDFSLSIP